MLDHPSKLRALAAMVNADIKSTVVADGVWLDKSLPGIHKQFTLSTVSDKRLGFHTSE